MYAHANAGQSYLGDRKLTEQELFLLTPNNNELVVNHCVERSAKMMSGVFSSIFVAF